MAAVLHDWEVVIDCPQCGQRGRVTVSLLRAMVRCPACRSRIVFGRDGVKKATREMILAGQAEVLAAQPPSRQFVRKWPRSFQRSGLFLAFVLPIVIVSLATVALRWSRQSNPSSLDSKGLTNQASQFADALIANDLDTAARAARVAPRELATWWRARRAVMTAGVGKHANGELKGLEVQSHGSEAMVCLTVAMGSHNHVFTQTWERLPVGWRLQVGPIGPSDK